MNVVDELAKFPPYVKKDLERRYKEHLEIFPPDVAEQCIFQDMVREELSLDNWRGTPFRHWLYCVKYTGGPDPSDKVTPEIWDEWQAAKPGYKPDLSRYIDYGCVPTTPEEKARWRACEERADAAKKAREVEAAKAAELEAAEDRRRAALAGKLQAYEFAEIELEPVDWMKLHALKKNPDGAKRKIGKRWQQRFDALPDDVRSAWQSFFGPIAISAISPSESDDVEGDDEVEDDDANYADGVGNEDKIAYLMPYPVNGRYIELQEAEDIEAALRDPAFEDFRRFSAGVNRLLDLIGNPIDDLIVPPRDPHRPQPATDVDTVAAAAKDVPRADIVPGFITRGLTIPHGDTKHCKSLLTQKAAIVIADDTGAKFEGIEVEHGTVIYATLDLNATKEDIAPGIIEIRKRLGLKPSGRLHVTDSSLVLNEPASVAHFLELNKARLPCKVIVVDSLFSAVAGSLSVDTVVRDAMEGVRTLLRHCDAMVVPHHDNKGGDIFGSQFIKAQMNSKIGVVRNELKDGTLGDQVKVRVEFLKFAEAKLKFDYTVQGPYLNADAAPDTPKGIKRPDILALLPTTPTPLGEARAPIEHLLVGKTKESRGEYWRKLRLHWVERGLVVADKNGTKGTICRVGEP